MQGMFKEEIAKVAAEDSDRIAVKLSNRFKVLAEMLQNKSSPFHYTSAGLHLKFFHEKYSKMAQKAGLDKQLLPSNVHIEFLQAESNPTSSASKPWAQPRPPPLKRK